MPYPTAASIDFSRLVFSKFFNQDGRQRVDLFMPDGKSKVVFNLCTDFLEPFTTMYGLDQVRDDADGSRRGQCVFVEDKDVEAALLAFDEAVIRTAVQNAKEWFKPVGGKSISEETIRDRYAPIMNKKNEDDPHYYIKFKVKTSIAKVPTKLHSFRGTDAVVENGGKLSDLEHKGAKMSPILSSFGLWFMGGGTRFGVSLQAEEIVVEPGKPKSSMSNFATKRSFETMKAESVLDEEEGEEDAEFAKKSPYLPYKEKEKSFAES